MNKTIITENLLKIVTTLPKYTKKRTIKKHIVCTSDIFEVEFTDGLQITLFTLKGLKNSNIQIQNLILDKDIPQDITDREVMPKFIGRKDSIEWI